MLTNNNGGNNRKSLGNRNSIRQLPGVNGGKDSNDPQQKGDANESRGNCAGFPPANVHIDEAEFQAAQQRMKRAGKDIADQSAANTTGQEQPGENSLPPGMCERPPFIVRHVPSNLLGRRPRLHKTLSQETNLMLMQYQRDHPSDTDVQTVCPDKVPAPLYRKLRQQYENQHGRAPTRKYKKPPAVLMRCPTNACNLGKDSYYGGARRPSLGKDKYITRNYSAPAAFDPSFTEQQPNERNQPVNQQQLNRFEDDVEGKARNNPINRDLYNQAMEELEETEIDPSICDMENVKKFLRKSGCRMSSPPETENKPSIRPPGRTSPKEKEYRPNREVFAPGGLATELYSEDEANLYRDDQEMAAVYRDVTRTLKQDKERKTNPDKDLNKWKNCE
ncbi:hypothetical protein RvY_07574 [Ramazzottius varieornatus]|uniref:Uncharacterized protein n=1 Tax=Ramazzottius varieornatus TaxID=947166 RepID=A0A1D1V7Q1_RAMVA|nr:hypothetical protein RvY_07574 [Ramazzottius varieornatus]